MSELRDNFLIVAAIDFGTSYMGYGYSSKSDFKLNPLKINCQTWAGGNLLSSKTAACALFDKDKNFKKFGFDAEDQYSLLADTNEHNDYYFFQNFKMELFHQMQLKRNFELKDLTGKKMPAMDVFSACIRFLKGDLWEKLQKSLNGATETDIRWVLTVPAIWNDVAKQFMREAAVKAGIADDMLLMALEPEAASLFCKHLPLSALKGSANFIPFLPGSKYLIFDAGGGTVDIAVHQAVPEGGLKEINAANGGDWGGTYVDKAFRCFLEDIYGVEIIDEFRRDTPSDYMDIFREFEIRKRKFCPPKSDAIIITPPPPLNEMFTKKHTTTSLGDHLQTLPKYRDTVQWKRGKLKIDREVVESFFNQACEHAAKHLKSLFSKDEMQDINTVLMVGGFSESGMLQKMVSNVLPRNMHIIIPADPGLVVLQGAVVFGHDPSVMKERISRYTYGVKSSCLFEESIHPKSKKFTDEGKEYCNDIFHVHVTAGQNLASDRRNATKRYRPTDKRATYIPFSFYASSDKNPRYVTDQNCICIGNINVEVASSGDDRSVAVKMIFGDTELRVEAVDIATNKRSKCALNFLG